MSRPFLLILAAATLDAIGIGLIFPILPDLLRSLSGQTDVSVLYGATLALFAAMQFVFSPLLGVLSDRFGRRPLLLVSIVGTTIDYLIMAFVPNLWVVLIGRTIAGITSANMAVATAYITDVTPEDDRARRFGMAGACFGIGFIVGPALGGVLGGWWLHAPFLAAAVLNGVLFVFAAVLLPEFHKPTRDPLDWRALNPLVSLRWALTYRPLVVLIAVFFAIALVSSVPGTMWVLWAQDRFQWNMGTIGLSLTVFGVFTVAAQALLTGPLTRWLGETGTVALSIVVESVAYVIMAFTFDGWVAFALAPCFALGSLIEPSLQAVMTRQVAGEWQGRLQGVLGSVNSLTTIAGPVAATTLYALTSHTWPGAIWVVAAVLFLLILPLLALTRGQLADAPAEAGLGT